VIVTEIAVFWQVQDRFFFYNLIIFIVKYYNLPFSDKVNLLDLWILADDCSAGWVKAAIHIYNHFVYETTLTILEEMREIFLKLIQLLISLNEIRLKFGSKLLIEYEFFNYYIEIIVLSLFNISSNIIVKNGSDLKRTVLFFHSFNPHV